MKFILAKKLHMTQLFAENGKVFPATVLQSGPMTVTQIKGKEKDGYEAIQVGFGSRKAKNLSKPVSGHMKNLGTFAHLKEIRFSAKLSADEASKDKSGETAGEAEKNEANIGAKKVGDKINVDIFALGDKVVVSAISKGKGFQGVVKRHGFAGGPRSHGQKHSEREPGSIGGGLRNKVPKGMRMAGRMGGERVTIKNLTVLQADPVKNILVVSGAVPGRRGTLVEVRG
ncbi:MAG: 50S ribosomal protein L3 [Patescibacteria group bacterium]